jgi:hypothetical protein
VVKRVILPGALALLYCQAGRTASVAPYTPDANTVLLDHFDGSTLGTVKADNNTGQPCGPALPATTPNYSFGTGPVGLGQCLELRTPSGVPVGSASYLEASSGIFR